MLSKNENFLTMARGIAKLLKDNENEWKVLPKFTVYVKELYQLMGITAEHEQGAEIETTGITEDKEKAGAFAINLAIKLTKRATSYALDKENAALKNQLKVSKHDLENGHDAHIVVKLNDVAARLHLIVTELKDYGVTDMEIKKLREAIDTYNNLLDKPSGMIKERKGQNEMAVEKIDDIKKLLMKMDGLINYFEPSKFEMDYQNTRIVIDLGSRKGKPKDGKDDKADDGGKMSPQ